MSSESSSSSESYLAGCLAAGLATGAVLTGTTFFLGGGGTSSESSSES
jgi:hypothetical protein